MQPTETITVEATVQAPLPKVWTYWTTPEHIQEWSVASDDWHTTSVTNDLRVGGGFKNRMEAKDGSAGFDFAGTYTEVEPQARVVYRIADGREVRITFEAADGGEVRVQETFAAETAHPVEMQREGWQSILDRFKRHVEER